MQNRCKSILITKPEPSADSTNVDETSILMDGLDGLEIELLDDCERNGCPIAPSRINYNKFTDVPASPLVCDAQKSVENQAFNQALEDSQKDMLKELHAKRDTLTKQDLLDLLSRQREMLLSVRECLEVQAIATANQGAPAKRRIRKAHRTGRKRASSKLEGAQQGTGALCVLSMPTEVDLENSMYLEDNYSLADFEQLTFGAAQLAPTKNYFSVGQDDDTYGMGRFGGSSPDRNLYFGLADSLNDFGHFD